jgi:GH18 family chitinase
MAADPAARKRFAENLARFCLDHQLSGADFDWEHPHDAAEERSYADLIVATNQAFRPHGLTISAALAGWQALPAAGFEALDRVHLMAYDHDGPRHATLELVQADIKQVLGRPGTSAEKLIVGIPCYARSLDKKGQTVTYAEVVKKHRPRAAVDETSGWYFNGLETVRTKARLVRDQNLGGVMFWELGQDAAGDASLIRAASQTLSRP